MKPRYFLILIAIPALMLLMACDREAEDTRPDILVITERGVIHRDNIIPALDWDRNPQSFTDAEGNTGTVWWDIADSLKMGCNFINPFPNYLKDGKSVSDAQLTGKHYQEILDYCQPGLEYSHQNGIKVVTSLPMCLMDIAQYEAAGEDWRLYSQVRADGSYPTDSSGITAFACINNPLFQKKIRECSVMAAKAGYDGMFYDAGPYSYGVDFNCNCKYCKKAWASYTKKNYGRKVSIPEGTPDLSTELGRLLWKWRHDIFINFVLSVRDECRTYNKDFTVWPNMGMNGTHSCYYTLKGLESSICEYGSNDMTNPGVESTLYFYRQYEAENPKNPLIMQFNSISSQANPDYKYDTAFVEALAGGGAVMASTSDQQVASFAKLVKDCSDIKANEPDAFCDSISIAETAVVYSWQEINACHPRQWENPSFFENPPRMAASLLAAEGIPYDYVMPERVIDLADLQRYKTLIFTEFNVLDKDFEKLVEEYIRQGGQVIIFGPSFARMYTEKYGVKYADWEEDVFEKWTGVNYFDVKGTGEYFTMGEGRVYSLKSYMRGKKAREETRILFENAGLYDFVRVTEDVAGNIETTIRSDASSTRWWLHCVTYASQGIYDDTPITVEVRIPDGENVLSVTGISPTVSADKMGLSWKQDGKMLTITATVGLWTMFRIEKSA